MDGKVVSLRPGDITQKMERKCHADALSHKDDDNTTCVAMIVVLERLDEIRA